MKMQPDNRHRAHRRSRTLGGVVSGLAAFCGCADSNSGGAPPLAGVSGPVVSESDDPPQSTPDAGAGDSSTASVIPRLCNVDGFCWAGRGVQSNTLLSLTPGASQELWATGEAGSVLQLVGDGWTRHAVPTEETLRGAWVGDDEVWVVGDDSSVFLRGAEGWAPVAVEGLELGRRLTGVYGDDSGNRWIVGAEGTVLERRAGTWRALTLDQPVELNAVWAYQGQAWAVGAGGVVLQLNEDGVATVDSGTGRDLYAVAGYEENVWFAGASGEIRYWDAEDERFVRPVGEQDGPTGALRSLQVDAAGDAHVVGDAGQWFHWDATAPCPADAGALACPDWSTPQGVGVDASAYGVAQQGDRTWVVGEYGLSVYFEDGYRSTVSPASSDNHLAVSGAADGSVWIAGDRLLRVDADGYEEIVRDSPRAFYAVQALGEEQLLVAGTAGTARSYTSEGWRSLDVSADAWLRGLWSDGQQGWLVGSRGRSWGLLNGSLWVEIDTPVSADLLSVHKTPGGMTWASGEGGVILRHDGAVWAQIPSGPDGGVQVDLRDVWGASDADLWAVGTGGTVLHYDGTRWEQVSEPAAYSLNAVWGSSATNVWAVGTAGTVLHYDGAEWTPRASGTRHTLNGVWGDADNVWIVGERDTVLIHPQH